MDEPCSALDPISTGKIEDLMMELKKDYSIVIVTHNMQQAARVSDKTAFFTVELDEDEDHRTGRVVEFDDDREDLHQPVRLADRGLRHREGGLEPWADTTRTHFQEELAELETPGARRPRHGGHRARPRARDASSTRTSSWPAW